MDGTYRLVMSCQNTSYNKTLKHKSWASICGHLSHVDDNVISVMIFSELTGAKVLEYNKYEVETV